MKHEHMIEYNNFDEFQNDVLKDQIHPADLKDAVADSLIEIISPLRDKLRLDVELEDIIRRSV